MKFSPYALCIFLLGSVNIATAQCFIYRIADPSAQPASSHLEAGSFLGSSRSSPALSATASFLGSQASFAFSADVSGINSAIVSADWEGTGFEQNLGIWYHTVTFDSPPTYNSDGSLSAFNLRAADFFDISNGNTIPEPSLALLGFFSSLLLLRRQR